MPCNQQKNLGDSLLKCFHDKSPVPFSDVNLRTGKAHAPRWGPDSSVSEISTIQLEFRDLSFSTGDPKYKNAVDNVSVDWEAGWGGGGGAEADPGSVKRGGRESKFLDATPEITKICPPQKKKKKKKIGQKKGGGAAADSAPPPGSATGGVLELYSDLVCCWRRKAPTHF